ncbi:hypothetical protein SDC9_108587 [bioreactor metagenome]|uniref:Uncharacterized protein n=1 Tax=bioreactor metagenome TaxID=1076179 RepID=A0A645B8K3_9ZZZZ
MGGHVAHDLLGEGTRLRRGADEDGGVHIAYHIGQFVMSERVELPAGHLVGGTSERRLEVAQLAALDQQAPAGQPPELADGLIAVDALGDHDVEQQMGDTHPGGSGAMDDDALIGESGVRGADGGQYRCHHDTGGALDVIVEGADLVAVAVEDPVGVAGGEVLPVQQCLWEAFGDLTDELLDERVIAFAAHPGMPDAQVGRIVQQVEIVGARVENHGQDPIGMDAGGRHVDRQFADGDGHASDALITNAEDALGVGDDDQIDVVGTLAGGLQRGLDAIGIVDVEVDAAWLVEPVAVFLNRQPDRRSVDDRQHLLDVVGEHSVEQRLIAVLHGRQIVVLGQIGRLVPILLVDATHLGVEADDSIREQPGQSERFALLLGERRAVVDHRVVQHIAPTAGDAGNVASIGVDDLVILGHGSSLLPGGAGSVAAGVHGRRQADTTVPAEPTLTDRRARVCG